MTSVNSVFNPSALNQLQADAKRDPKNALRQAAEQFESIFLNQMLKSMRDAVGTASEDDPFQSSETKTFQGLLDQQWSTQLSRTKGLGIADMIVRQLSKELPALGAAGQAASSSSATASNPAAVTSAPVSTATASAGFVSSATGSARPPLERQELPVEPAQIAGAAKSFAKLGQTRAEFVERLLPHAQRAAERLGVAPELIVAHAALETGWGKHPLKGEQGEHSFNLFGVKAGSRWQGKVAAAVTTEFENGVPSRRVERFRSYDNYSASFDDYANLLSRPRYAGIRNAGTDASAFAQALQSAGYATDPNYAKKLQQVASSLLSRA